MYRGVCPFEEKMLEEFRQAIENRHEHAMELKARGHRIMGWMCSYVPEELIHAAGFIPLRVIGGKEDTSTADAYLYINMCSLVRSTLEEGMRGKYSYLDGLITLNTCDNMRRLFDVWAQYLPMPFLYILSLPRKANPEAVSFFKSQLQNLKDSLENFSNKEIKEKDLKHAIRLYNSVRKLQKELAESKKDGAGGLSGADLFMVNLAGSFLTREEYLSMLENLKQEIKESRPAHSSDEKVRLLVMGSELDSPDLFQLIESCGGNIVVEDLCTGSKTFWNLVDEAGDPLEALARSYLLRPPCPRMMMTKERLEHLRKLIRDFLVQGIVHESIKFCKLYEEDCITIQDEIKRMGLPFLSLSREYVLSASGQFKTRMEAFVESLSV